MNKEILEIIVCPKCKSSLKEEKKFLICEKCRLAYPIIDKTIPNLLVSDAIKLDKLYRKFKKV
jgi:hypothetical protein